MHHEREATSGQHDVIVSEALQAVGGNVEGQGAQHEPHEDIERLFAFDPSLLQHRATQNATPGFKEKLASLLSKLWYKIEAEKQTTHMGTDCRGQESSCMESQFNVDLWSDSCHWATIDDKSKHVVISTPRPHEATLPSVVASSRHKYGGSSQQLPSVSEYAIDTHRGMESCRDGDSTASVVAGNQQNIEAGSSRTTRRRRFGLFSFGVSFLKMSRWLKCTCRESNEEKLIMLIRMQEFLQRRAAKLNLELDIPETDGISSF